LLREGPIRDEVGDGDRGIEQIQVRFRVLDQGEWGQSKWNA
jgi:hypothetical protein